MCFRKKQKPKSLKKREEPVWLEWAKWSLQQPEGILIVIFVIAFIILIIFALNESISYFYYNRGGLIL